MPRYFVSTSDGVQAHDEEGLVLPDLDELSVVMRQTLAAMLHDERQESDRDERSEFIAEAHDEDGHQVMTARVNVVTHRP